MRLKRLVFRLEWSLQTYARRWEALSRKRRAARARVSVQLEFPQWVSGARE